MITVLLQKTTTSILEHRGVKSVPLDRRIALDPEATKDDRLDFAERVGRSIRRGDFLLLIVGDHIRTDAQRISDLL